MLWQAIAVLVDYGLALEKNDVGKALVNMTMQLKPDFTPTRKAIQLSKPGAGVQPKLPPTAPGHVGADKTGAVPSR